MQWSQLRKRLLDRVASSIRSRVDIHQTRYRSAHDQEGEIWLTLDKERVFSSGSASYLGKRALLIEQIHRDGATLEEAHEQARPLMESSGLMLLEEMNKDLFDSLNQSIDEMLEHKNSLIRALALIDSRCGKRRLAAFDPSAEHEIVRRLYAARCRAEGLKTADERSGADSSAAG